MKKRLKTFLAFLFILFSGLIAIFAENGWPKKIGTAISLTALTLTLIDLFFGHHRSIKRLKARLRRDSFFKYLLADKAESGGIYITTFQQLKDKLLTFMKNLLDERAGKISSPNTFNYDFKIDPAFVPGVRDIDRNPDWKVSVDKRFLFITGDAGTGKSYAIVKRAQYACTLAEERPVNERKIPVYIELKSLEEELNDDWIVDYIIKTAEIKRINLNQNDVEKLIASNEVTYFFDGLDEVAEKYRTDCLQSIIKYADRTGVHVSCKKIIYDEFFEYNQIETNIFPAEECFSPLTYDQMCHIIRGLEGLSSTEQQMMINFISNKPNLLVALSRHIMLNIFIIVFKELNEEKKAELATAEENKTIDILMESYDTLIYQKNSRWMSISKVSGPSPSGLPKSWKTMRLP